MDFTLTEEHRAFRKRFDRFCQERIAPRAQQAEMNGEVPKESVAELAETGYFGLFHPKELGGSGADSLTMAIAMESLAKACASTYWLATSSSLLTGKMLHALGNAQHHEKFLAPLARGQKLGCFAVVETGAGGDSSTYSTTVRRAGERYILSGFKARISNAPLADICVLVANFVPDRPEDGPPGLRFVFFDLGSKGVRRLSIPKIGLTAMPWGGLILDNVEVPAEDVLPADFAKVVECTEWGQVMIAHAGIGIAEASLDAALEFSASRNSFGRPLAHLQSVHRILATMRTEIDAARMLAQQALWTKTKVSTAGDLTQMTKVCGTEMSIRVTQLALDLFASWGISRHFIVERLHRDAVANAPAGLSNEMLRDLVAAKMVGQNGQQHRPFDWLTPFGFMPDAASISRPEPQPHTRMYANRTSIAFEWNGLDRSILEREFGARRSPRTVNIADPLWDGLRLRAAEMGMDPQALLHQAIQALLSSGKS